MNLVETKLFKFLRSFVTATTFVTLVLNEKTVIRTFVKLYFLFLMSI